MTQKERKQKALRKRDGDTCCYCGQPIDFSLSAPHHRSWSLEHVVSKAHGGSNQLNNLKLAHALCNTRVGCLQPAEKKKLMKANGHTCYASTRPRVSLADMAVPKADYAGSTDANAYVKIFAPSPARNRT